MSLESSATTLTSNVTDVALIFEGGAMRASYTAAVAVTLLRAGIHFDWVAGVSAGSSNAANYLSRDPARTRRSFVEFAADPHFGSLGTFLRGQGMFNASFIYQQSCRDGGVLPFDFATFQANPARIRIGTFQADTGRVLYWGRSDTATLDDLMVRVQASSSLPFLMPTVTLGGHTYMDGALGPSGGIALDAARADGYTRFFAVLTRPRGYVKRATRISRTIRSYFRGFPAVVDALDQRAANYNRTRAELAELERSGQAVVFYPEGYTVPNVEKSVSKLARSYEAGRAQAARELPAWREWLGL